MVLKQNEEEKVELSSIYSYIKIQLNHVILLLINFILGDLISIRIWIIHYYLQYTIFPT